MQLADLGAIANIRKTLGEDPLNIGEVFDILSAKQQEVVLTTNLLSDSQKKLIISNAETSVSEEGVNVAMAKTAAEDGVVAGANTGLAASFEGLGVAVESLWAKFIASPLAPIVAIGAAVAVVVGVVDLLTTSTSEASEALEKSTKKFDDVNSKLDEMNGKLKENAERIEELNRMKKAGTISIANQDELDRLEKENGLLERQIELQKVQQANAAKQVLKDTGKFFNAKNSILYSHAGETDVEAIQSIIADANRQIDKYNSPSTAESILNGKDAQQYIEQINQQIEAYQQLEDAGIEITGSNKQYYDSLVDIQDQLLATEYRINQNASAYQALSKEQKKAAASQKLVDEGLSQEQADAVVKKLNDEELDAFYDVKFNFEMPEVNEIKEARDELQKYADDQGITLDLTTRPVVDAKTMREAGWTEFEDGDKATVYSSSYSNEDGTKTVLVTPILPDGTVLSEEALEEYANKLLNGEEIDVDIELGMFTGKDSIQQAGKAGEFIHNLHKKLFVDDLNNSNRNIDEFADKYVSAMKKAQDANSEFANSMNKAVDATKKLEGLDDQLSGISDALAKKKDDGFVDNDTFGGLQEKLGSLENWGNFVNTLGNAKSTMAECQQAANDLATEYANGADFLSDLSEENAGYYATALKSMGVENAETLVLERLSIARQEEALNEQLVENSMSDLSEATNEELDKLAQICGWSEQATIDYKALALAKQTANGTTLDLSADLDNIISIIEGLGMACTALKTYNSIKTANADIGIGDTGMKWYADKAKSEVMAAFDMSNLKISTPKINVNPNGSSEYKNNSGSTKTDKDTTKEYDLIEIAISRLQHKITNLGKTVSATFKSWSNRNSAIKKEIDAVTKEISLQQKAYKAYEAKATAVELPEDIKAKFRDGSIEFFSTTDENLQKQIDEFQNWYSKALEANDAIADLKANVADLAKQKFDNIAKQFDQITSSISHSSDMLDAYMKQIETAGYVVSTKYYDRLKETGNQSLSNLKKELKKQQKELKKALKKGKIKEGSEMWNEMTESIRSTEKAIEDAKTQLLEYAKAQRELEWSNFERGVEWIKDMVSEAEFLMEIMSQEQKFDQFGNTTSQGKAYGGLYTQNLETYKQLTKEYANEIAKLDSQYANNTLNVEYIEQRRKLVQAEQEVAKSQINTISSIMSLEKERYDAQMKYLQKVADKTKEALNAQKSIYDYQKNISKLSDNVNNYQKQLMAIRGDNSEDAKSRRQKLEASLKDAKLELEETEYDKFISDQSALIDKTTNEVQEWMDEDLKDVNKHIDLVASETKNNREEISNVIKSEAANVGVTISDSMNNIWSGNIPNIITAIDRVTDAIKSQNTQVSNATDNSGANGTSGVNENGNLTNGNGNVSQQNAQEQARNEVSKVQSWKNDDGTTTASKDGKGTVYANAISFLNGNLSKPAKVKDKKTGKERAAKASDFKDVNAAFFKSWGGKVLSDSELKTLAKIVNVKYDNSKKSGALYKKLKAIGINGFKKGSKNIPYDQLAWTQENGGEVIYRQSDGAMLTPLGQGDMVFTKEMSENLYKMAQFPQLSNISTPTVTGITTNNKGGDVNMELHLDNIAMYGVNDVEQFGENLVDQIQNNRTVQKSFTKLVTNGVLGRNSLNIKQ